MWSYKAFSEKYFYRQETGFFLPTFYPISGRDMIEKNEEHSRVGTKQRKVELAFKISVQQTSACHRNMKDKRRESAAEKNGEKTFAELE